MKKLLLFLVLTGLAYGQQSVRTELASNRYASYTAAGTDTISNARYFDGIVFNTVVASDTITIKNGAATVAKIIFGASPPAYPFYVRYGVRVDSTYFSTVRVKASDITIIYRLGF